MFLNGLQFMKSNNFKSAILKLKYNYFKSKVYFYSPLYTFD